MCTGPPTMIANSNNAQSPDFIQSGSVTTCEPCGRHTDEEGIQCSRYINLRTFDCNLYSTGIRGWMWIALEVIVSKRNISRGSR